MKDRPSDTETLRLVTAFFDIQDQETRRLILLMTEAAASGAPITAETMHLFMSEAKPH